MKTQNGRVRAWVLVKSKDAHGTARALSEYFPEGGDDFIVVRADVVEGEFDLIVPVDVVAPEALEKVLALVVGAPGVIGISVASVRQHYPDPPHAASTFVTAGEYERDPVPEFDPPGRHPKSPGRNAWG